MVDASQSFQHVTAATTAMKCHKKELFSKQHRTGVLFDSSCEDSDFDKFKLPQAKRPNNIQLWLSTQTDPILYCANYTITTSVWGGVRK